MNKNVKSTNWLLTRNFREGEELDAEAWLRAAFVATKAKYLVGQLEQGLKEERRHIQAYVHFAQQKTLLGLKKYDAEMHCDIVKIDNGVRDYCMKELTRVAGPWEFGERPVRRNSKEDWDEVRELAKSGEFDRIPSGLYIQNLANLHKLNELSQPDGSDIGHLRGILIWGEAGVGKSLFAREYVCRDLSIYNKAHNKWWTGFKGQKKVIWDDLNLEEAKIFGNQFKLYMDRYAIRGEVKGATVPLDYEFFVITSQYSLEQLFQDQETYDAISRRCYVYHMSKHTSLEFPTQFSHLAMKQKLFSEKKPDLDKHLKD